MYDLDAIAEQLTVDVNSTGRIVQSVTIGRKLSIDNPGWTATIFFVGDAKIVSVVGPTPDEAAAKALQGTKDMGSPRIESLRTLQRALIDAKAKRLPSTLELPASRLANALAEELGDA